jgi:hypothetical protein
VYLDSVAAFVRVAWVDLVMYEKSGAKGRWTFCLVMPDHISEKRKVP